MHRVMLACIFKLTKTEFSFMCHKNLIWRNKPEVSSFKVT